MLATSTLLVAALATVATSVAANPAVEHAFRRYVNSNECLRACMRPIEASERDIAIFKQSNFADYLLHLDETCATISTARSCIDACGIRSNPFALASVTKICSPEARRDASALTECLQAEGEIVHTQCASECGTKFETINELLRAATATAKPDNARTRVELTKMSGDACSSLKCTSRCAIAAYNERCEPIRSGAVGDGGGVERAGDALRRLIEDVLGAHRADLEAHGLVETMQANTAPECNYHYAPLALFSVEHDAETLQAARHMSAALVPPAAPATAAASAEAAAAAAEGENLLASLKRDAARRINLTLGQLHMRLLEKQADVLDKQARNLDRDFDKTNFELARLLHKPRGPLFAPAPAFF